MAEGIALLGIAAYVSVAAALWITRRLRRSKTPNMLYQAYVAGSEAAKAFFDSDPEDVIDPDVVPDAFCPGCGATVKKFGPHKCFYCGTALNVPKPKPKVEPVDSDTDYTVFGLYMPMYKTEGVGRPTLDNICVRE